MKKINIILGIATMAFLASCGNATETKTGDSAASTTTETPAPAAETPAATETPATTETPAEGTPSVEVNKDGASMKTDKGSVEVSKDGIKASK